MSTQYANMLRQRMYEGNQMGGALMGGALDGAALLAPYGSAEKEARSLLWKGKHPGRVSRGKMPEGKEKEELKAKLKAGRDKNHADLVLWYNSFKINNNRQPTGHEIKVAKATQALERAKLRSKNPSRAGETAAAKSLMTPKQLDDFNVANNKVNAALAARNKLISDVLRSK